MAVLVISYSRADQLQVRQIITLLRASLRGVDRAVYWDDQFEPGEPWFDQLKAHIDTSPLLFVFWCEHSYASEEVRKEFTYALQQKKLVVPVLLDDTPLVDELAPIHGIDLRGSIRHGRPSRISRAIPVLGALLVALVATQYLWRHSTRSVEPAATTPSASVAVLEEPSDTQQLNSVSKRQLDALLERYRLISNSTLIEIESHAGAQADSETDAVRTVRRYLGEHEVVPWAVQFIQKDGTANDPFRDRIVVRLHELAGPQPVLFVVMIAVLVIVFVGWPIVLSYGLWRLWTHRKFVINEFARYLR